jgi:hypothetical protein
MTTIDPLLSPVTVSYRETRKINKCPIVPGSEVRQFRGRVRRMMAASISAAMPYSSNPTPHSQSKPLGWEDRDIHPGASRGSG